MAARGRLAEERKAWRKDHPFGFVAKPEALADGSVNLLKWVCVIPGKAGTKWAAGAFPVTLNFTDDYPNKAPQAYFPKGFFHPNVYPSGLVCLSILNDLQGWKPSVTIKQILTGIQELLDSPNVNSAAQHEGFNLLSKQEKQGGNAYDVRVALEVRKYPAQD